MTSHSRVKPQSPHNNNDDLSSLFSRPSIQNSPDWPSVQLRSPGSSVRTLNQSDCGTFRDDHSSLANCSRDPSVQSSMSTVSRSTSPFSFSSRHRPISPSSSFREQDYTYLSSDKEKSEESPKRSRGGGSTPQWSPSIRADKRPYQARSPPLAFSSRRPTIGSTLPHDDGSHRDASLLISNVNEDLPNTASNPSRSRSSTSQSQSRTPTLPLLNQATFRDSVSSYNSDQTVDAPIAWTGAWKDNTRGQSYSRDPKGVPTPAGVKEPMASGDLTTPNESNRRKHSAISPFWPEMPEVKASVPELVSPATRPARSRRATSDTKTPRSETRRAKILDRLPTFAFTNTTQDKTDHNAATKTRAYGWGLVQPATRSRDIPGTSPHPSIQSSREVPTDKGRSTNYDNLPSISQAAKPIVAIDALEVQRQATSSDVPQSRFREHFPLS